MGGVDSTNGGGCLIQINIFNLVSCGKITNK
jgi:hypothetical protein